MLSINQQRTTNAAYVTISGIQDPERVEQELRAKAEFSYTLFDISEFIDRPSYSPDARMIYDFMCANGLGVLIVTKYIYE